MLSDDQQIFDQIQKANNIVITFTKDSNGDVIGGALALMLFLQKLDKQAVIVCDGFKKPENLSFLPGIDTIQPELLTEKKFVISLDTSEVTAHDITYQVHDNKLDFIVTARNGQFSKDDISTRSLGEQYDLVIVLGTPDLDSLGKVYTCNTQFFFNTPIINIDHSPRNEEFGQVTYVTITAISVTEILFNILHTYSAEMVDPDIATCLLTGIIAKSKSFKIGSLTPTTLTIASRLVNLKARREEIVRHLYHSHDLNTLKLWGRVLAKLQQALVGRVIWSALNEVDFTKTNTKPDDLQHVMEELITNVPDAEVLILFTESNDTRTAQVYTFKNIDARELMTDYDAQGVKNHVTITSTLPLNDFESEVVDYVKKQLAKLPV